MTYFPDLHAYLHQSSLLIQAYPHTTRITTKYSPPRQPKPSKTSPSDTTTTISDPTTKPKRDPSATLTLKTFHPASGICLKYKTDKAAEVSRLMTGLGRLAKGEVIEMPTATAGEGGDAPTATGAGVAIGSGEALSNGGPSQLDRMDVDTPPPSGNVEAKTVAQMTQQQGGGGGGGKKKKKNKK